MMFNEIDKSGEISIMAYLSKPNLHEIEDAEYLELGSDIAEHLYYFLKESKWSELLDKQYDLQCVSIRESDGKPLLSSYIPVDDFSLLVDDMVLLTDIHSILVEVLEQWREQGCDVVMIDFERL